MGRFRLLFTLSSAFAALGFFSLLGQCSILYDEAHFAFRDGHIYVLPRSGFFQKIEKESGKVIWQSQVMHEGRPYRGGSYTHPVFLSNKLYTIEMYDLALISVNCETGEQIEEYKFRDWVGSTAHVPYHPLSCGELIIAGDTYYVQAYAPERRFLAWNLGFKSGEFSHLWDYFQVGESLYILADSLLRDDESGAQTPLSRRTGDYLVDETLGQFEMMQLDCHTGKISRRFDGEALFGTADDIRSGREIGGWEDKRIIVGELGQTQTIIAFDPETESADTLATVLVPPEFVQQHPKVSATLLIADNAVIYSVLPKQPEETYEITIDAITRKVIHLPNRKPALVARSLDSGRVLWVMKTEILETPYCATNGMFFTGGYHGEDYAAFGRDISSGDLIWTRKLDDPDPFPRLYGMQMADGYLYIQTSGYLRAVNTAGGEDLWEVSLIGEHGPGWWRERKSSWSGVKRWFDWLVEAVKNL